jgi:uncharacterized protein YneF (UPF0154 family)
MSISLIISVIGALIAVGGVFIAIGVFKGKINQNAEVNNAQNEQIKKLASRDELAAAIKRSDEMLEFMRKRAEEDRTKGQSQWHDFPNILSKHAERIGALETQQNILVKSLDEIKVDLKSGFKDLQNELKELRKQA